MLLSPVRKIALFLGVAAAATLLSSCATPPPADDPDAVAEFEQINDPFEPTNRVIFDANETVDSYVLRPVALGYRRAVPQFGRDRVNDFLGNLRAPIFLANDLLQGNVNVAGITLGRFLMNTTFGVFGIMDVAAPMGLPKHESDFGETLGVWGVGEGPYLVLPLFGGSNPRDAAGLAIESYVDPLAYYLSTHNMRWVSYTRTAVGGIALRESYLDALDDVKRTSLDYYSAMRSLTRQRRNAQIEQAQRRGALDAPGNYQFSVPALPK